VTELAKALIEAAPSTAFGIVIAGALIYVVKMLLAATSSQLQALRSDHTAYLEQERADHKAEIQSVLDHAADNRKAWEQHIQGLTGTFREETQALRELIRH